MIDEMGRLLSVSGYLPHGYCISWSPTLLMTYVVSDVLIFLSYFSITVTIAYFARRRKDFPFPWLLWLFAAFIMACGATHLMGAVVLWQPMYGLDALLKALTAVVSVLAAIVLWPLVPHAMKLPSASELEQANRALQTEITVRKGIEKALHVANRQVEEALQKERILMVTIVEASNDAIYAKDLDGRYLMVNREAARILGRTAEQILGCDDAALFPPQQAAIIRGNDALVIAENRVKTFEDALSTLDGERVYLATKGPLHDGDGKLSGLFGIARDITERHKAATELQEHSAALALRNDELERFNRVAVGRELDMVKLKQQVNALSRQLGQVAPFALAGDDSPTGAEAGVLSPPGPPRGS